MRTRWLAGVIGGILLGLGTVLAIEAVSDDASAQSGFSVSTEQLRINQRISQAAVRRSNEGLNLLDPVRKSGAQDDAPGWRSSEIRDSAVTAAKLASGAVTESKLGSGAVTESRLGSGAVTESRLGSGAVTEAKLAAALASRLPLWGVTDGATPPTLLRGRGVTAFTRISVGDYRAEFERDVSQCSWMAIPGADSGLPTGAVAFVALDPIDPTRIVVRTLDFLNVIADSPFHVQAFC